MRVCQYCLQAIESHERRFFYMGGEPVDENDENESRCEWCEEIGNDILFDI